MGAGETGTAFTLSAPAFDPGGQIPSRYTCDGADQSPALTWHGGPSGTKSFALIVDDPDAPAGTWVHWVVYDLPAETTALPEGVVKSDALPNGGKQGSNDFRKVGYNGPCPPPGKPHRYFFKLYALDGPIGLQPRATKTQVLRAIEGHVLGQTEMIGTYKR
jgi:Raf kinase inhibitor-like YbhB/YbcL family protein